MADKHAERRREIGKLFRRICRREYDFAVRVDCFPYTASPMKFAAVGWRRNANRVVVSAQPGNTSDEAILKVLRIRAEEQSNG